MRSIRGPAIPLVACILLGIFLLAPGCLQQQPSGQKVVSGCPEGDLLLLTEEVYPYSYMDSTGTLTGTSVAVVREMVRRSGCSARMEVHSWNTSYEKALHTPGAALFSTVRTPDREPLFLWAGPIGTFGYVLYARNDSGIRLESMEAARAAGTIAVVQGDARHTFLVENRFTDIRTYPTDAECLAALENRSVALWFGSSAAAPGIMADTGVAQGSVVPVYTLHRVDLYLAFQNTTSPDTVRRFQEILDAMKADGTYARLAGTAEGEGKSAGPAAQAGGVPARTLLSALSSLVGTRMHGISAAMESLALTSDVRSGDWERVRPLLVRLEADHPEARFWYARPDGSYYTTVDNLTSANIRDRSYFPVVLGGKTSIGTVVLSKTTGKYTAIIAVPVRSGGNVTQILGTSVYCDSLEDALARSLPLPDGYYFFVLDTEGNTVLDSLPDRTFSLAGDPAAIASLLSREEGDVSYRFEGASHRAVFATEGVTGWKVAIGWRE
ncbi:MAG: transporter substrate-binding domain-containing protein [Methanolinea sp.]|jgi:ABC-type amino acid transport substrate-binding protein|nr:transporter substrate-binding domain-containing protein [Methanolinea sp.]